jgi:thiol-disulfide isomerase/thioredoxin
MRAAGYSALLLTIATMVAGCGATISSQPPAADGSGTPAENAGPRVSDKKIDLAIGDEKKLAEMLAARSGQVVFVDYWATWCESCVEFFPHTVETHNKYKDRGLATIAVSFDLLEKEQDVRKFLADHGADFDNLLSNYDDVGQEVADAFQFDVLPQFRLYDRTGKVRYEWKDKPTDLDQRIEELLAEQS